jgi:phosphatidate cytidylyltransferase
MSLRTRTPTALILLAALFVTVQFAPLWLYFLVLQLLIIAALIEFFNLAGRRRLLPQPALGIALALILGASFYFPSFPVTLAFFLCIAVSSVYFLLSFTTLERLPFFTSSIAITFFGAVYVGFTMDFFYSLRVDWGPFYLYFLFGVIFLGDTGAYLIGKLIGRHKMTPIASPNKTWEGSFGGILFACLGALAARELLLRNLPLGKAILLGVVVHAVAQVSDPLESLFKRAVGVKDSSNVLPGHGGFLDRVDSLLLAAPVFFYLLKYLVY